MIKIVFFEILNFVFAGALGGAVVVRNVQGVYADKCNIS